MIKSEFIFSDILSQFDDPESPDQDQTIRSYLFLEGTNTRRVLVPKMPGVFGYLVYFKVGETGAEKRTLSPIQKPTPADRRWGGLNLN